MGGGEEGQDERAKVNCGRHSNLQSPVRSSCHLFTHLYFLLLGARAS